VCDVIADKLTRRHPHVFGDVSVSARAKVVTNWSGSRRTSGKQKGQAPRSAIGGVPVSLPALVRAERLTEKAGAVGFDWPDAKAVLAKVREELDELTEAMGTGAPQRIEHELGDLLFAVATSALAEGASGGGAAWDLAPLRIALPAHRAPAGRARKVAARVHAG